MGKHVSHDDLVRAFGDHFTKRGLHYPNRSKRRLTLLKLHTGQEWNSITAQMIADYLDILNLQERSETLTALKHLRTMIERDKSLSSLTAAISLVRPPESPLVSRYRKQLREAGLVRSSVYTYSATARAFLKWAEAQGRALSDPKAPTDFLAVERDDSTREVFYYRRMVLRSFFQFLVSEGKLKANPLGELNKNWAYERAAPWERKELPALVDPELQRASMIVVPLAVPEIEPPDSSPAHPLEREIEHLKMEIKRLCHAVQFKDRVLEENLITWRQGLTNGIWPSVGEACKLRRRLESALREDGERFMPQPSREIEERHERAFKEKVVNERGWVLSEEEIK